MTGNVYQKLYIYARKNESLASPLIKIVQTQHVALLVTSEKRWNNRTFSEWGSDLWKVRVSGRDYVINALTPFAIKPTGPGTNDNPLEIVDMMDFTRSQKPAFMAAITAIGSSFLIL